MKKALKNIGVVLGIIALNFYPVKAQSPLFAGYNGSRYALESRVNQDRQITESVKTFRNEVPMWAYFGASLNKADKPFYGIGTRIEIGRFHTLPTVEGYNWDFTGISGYSTLDLPKGCYLDLVPHLGSNLKYNGTEFTLHKGIRGISFGLSSELKDGKLKNLKEIDLQFGKYWDGSNITGSLNLKTKKGKLSFQKNFK